MYAPPTLPSSPTRSAVIPIVQPVTPIRTTGTTSGTSMDPFDTSLGSPSSLSTSLGQPGSPSSPGSPIRRLPSSRTLRRKRSSANAALTSRPSTLGMRDRSGSRPLMPAPILPFCVPNDATSTLETSLSSLSIGAPSMNSTSNAVGGGGAMSPTSSDGSTISSTMGGATTRSDVTTPDDVPGPGRQSCEEGIQKWTPSLHNLVLVHIDRLGNGELHLGHALFQPNLLICRRGRILPIIDHAQWAHIRATVEESRIVYMSAEKQNTVPSEESSVVHSANSLYDVSMAGPDEAAVSSTFYIQPRADALQSDDSVTAPNDLMALTVKGVGGGQTQLQIGCSDAGQSHTCIDQTKWDALPSQLRSLLRQTDEVVRAAEANMKEAEGGGGGGEPSTVKAINSGNEQLCNSIIQLVCGSSRNTM